MSRGTSVNYTGALSFTYATTGPDLFKMTDVQQLAQAVELHTHDAVGKGLGVAGTAIKNAIDMPDWFRSTGQTSPLPTSGQGIEMFYSTSSSVGVVQSYNRGASQFMPVQLMGSTVALFIGAGSQALTISNTGATVLNYPVTCNQDLAVGGQTHLTGTLTCNGISCAGITSSAGATITGNASVSATLSVGALTTPNSVTAGQFNVGTGGQYILPVGVSIRYTVASGGVHSFESTAGGTADITCNRITGNVTHTGPLITSAPPISGSAGICFGMDLGQGNGAASVLPLQKGTGFGPVGGSGVGWVRFYVGPTACYFPYWT